MILISSSRISVLVTRTEGSMKIEDLRQENVHRVHADDRSHRNDVKMTKDDPEVHEGETILMMIVTAEKLAKENVQGANHHVVIHQSEDHDRERPKSISEVLEEIVTDVLDLVMTIDIGRRAKEIVAVAAKIRMRDENDGEHSSLMLIYSLIQKS